MLDAHENATTQRFARLSAAYNFDVGLFLRARRPTAGRTADYPLHFRLGKFLCLHTKNVCFPFLNLQLKPWHFFGLPLFPLSWKWQKQHQKAAAAIAGNRAHDDDATALLLRASIALAILVVYRALSVAASSRLGSSIVVVYAPFERLVVASVALSAALLHAASTTPLTLPPALGWSQFIATIVSGVWQPFFFPLLSIFAELDTRRFRRRISTVAIWRALFVSKFARLQRGHRFNGSRRSRALRLARAHFCAFDGDAFCIGFCICAARFVHVELRFC